MNNRKTFICACTIGLLFVLVAIITIIIVSLISYENAATEESIPERLIEAVRDEDLMVVADLLALTNEFVNLKPDENE